MAPSTPPVPTAIALATTGGATTMEIATIPVGAGTPTWVFVTATSAGEITFTPSSSDIQYPTYGGTGVAAYDRSIKTGLGAAGTVRSAAPGSDAANALMIAASNGIGATSRLLFRIHNPDDSWYSGVAVFGAAKPMNGNRAVFEYSFDYKTDGPYAYTAPGA